MDLQNTRLSLHAVAELLLAGPQYAASGTIKLRVTPGGFGTVSVPEVRVAGTSLITQDQVISLADRTIAEVANAAGLTARSLSDVYADHVDATSADILQVDPAEAGAIVEAFRRGHEALMTLAPDETPILWPEHFDLAIAHNEINYGVSGGDTYLNAPYAYVGPWGFASAQTVNPSDERLGDEFWNAPFGGARPVSEIPDLLAFFHQGQLLSGQEVT
jgi:hypothetical protein